MPHLKICFGAVGGEAVKRAHQLAIVATINAVAHGFAKRLGHDGGQFDGEVRNAAPRIHRMWAYDGPRGAGLDAATALTAMAIDGFGGLDFYRGEQSAQKIKAAGVFLQKQSVFATPTQTGLYRKRHL